MLQAFPSAHVKCCQFSTFSLEAIRSSTTLGAVAQCAHTAYNENIKKLNYIQ